HRAFNARVRRRLDTRAVELSGHVLPDSIRGDFAGSRPEQVAAPRFFEIVQVGILHAALRRFSGTESGTPSSRNSRHLTWRAERSQRSGSRSIFRSKSEFSEHLADCRRSDEPAYE